MKRKIYLKDAINELHDVRAKLDEASNVLLDARIAVDEALHMLQPNRWVKKPRRMSYALAFGIREHAKCYPARSLQQIAQHFGITAQQASDVIDGGKWMRKE